MAERIRINIAFIWEKDIHSTRSITPSEKNMLFKDSTSFHFRKPFIVTKEFQYQENASATKYAEVYVTAYTESFTAWEKLKKDNAFNALKWIH